MSDDHDHEHPHQHPHAADESGVHFSEVTPILNVANVAASLEYYVRVLGFGVDFAWSNETQFAPGGAAPTYAQVRRGHVALALAQQTQGGPGMWVYVDIDSAAQLRALHQAYQASGARIAAAPAAKPWNQVEMLVEDLDGHTLRLGAPLDGS
ncbi:MAG: glyoxalase superfamily protein [Anaerolineales bacterium]